MLDVLAGEKETTEKRRIIRKALYEGSRKADETLAQYSLRRESEFSQASRYLQIPGDMKGFMLEEQSGLSKQGLQNLRALTGGSSSFEDVKRALRAIDVDEETMCRPKNASYFQDSKDASAEIYQSDEPEVSDEEDILDSNNLDDVFFALDRMELSEDDTWYFLADWQKRKRTWSENKELKNTLKKDRRHFADPESRAPKDPPAPHRRKKNIAELKRITRCANCGEKGHWRAECQQPYKPKGDKSKTLNAFSYMGTGSGGSSHFGMNFLNGDAEIGKSYMTIPPGHAIIDPGASQELIGEAAFNTLKERLAIAGLAPVILDEVPPQAAGIGGSARPLFNALTPIFLGGKPGIVKLTVLADEIPELLSIGLLEHTGAIIDTESNEIKFKRLQTAAHMKRLESGHRVLDVTLGAGQFEPPKEVLDKHGLKPNAFQF